jgi:hypothetical protein
MVWHHKKRFGGSAAIRRPTFEILSGSEGVSGVDQLPETLVIPGNGNSVTPVFRYRGGDADATDLDAWTYGETLTAQGSGGTFNAGSPYLGASDDSFNPGGTRYFEASGGTFGQVSTEDVWLEAILRYTSTANKHAISTWDGTTGYSLYTTATGYRVLVDDNVSLVVANTPNLEDGAWYYVALSADASGSMIMYANATAGSAVDISSVGDITGGTFTIGAYSGGLSITTVPVAYCALYKGAGLLDGHAQAALAQERFQRLCGLWPRRAVGTKAWTVFTRATTAVLDKVEYGSELLPSTDPTSGWTQTRATVAVDTSVTHPEGDTVYAVSEDGTEATTHYLLEISIPSVAGTEYEISLDVKEANRTWLRVRANDTPDTLTHFDVGNGVVGTVDADNTATSIESIGDGWYRCRQRIVSGAGSQALFIYIGEADNDVTFDGLSQVSLYVARLSYKPWQSKLYTMGAGHPRMCYRQEKTSGADFKGYLAETADQNQLLYSEDLTDATWVKVRATISDNGAVAPDGETTADGIIGSAVGNTHYVEQSLSSTTAQHLYSTYVKAGAQDWCKLHSPNVANAHVYLDLSTGTQGTAGAGVDAAHIEPVGNGWFRVAMEYSGGAASHAHHIHPAEADNDDSFTGDGVTVDLWAWGAGHSDDFTDYPSSYTKTEASTVTRNADVLYLKGDDGNVADNQRGAVELDTLFHDVNNTEAPAPLTISDGGAAADRVLVYAPSTQEYFQPTIQATGGDEGSVTGTTDMIDGDAHTSRVTWDEDSMKYYVDGTQEGSEDTSLDPPDGLDRIHIGTAQDGTAGANALVRKLRIWKTPTTKA